MASVYTLQLTGILLQCLDLILPVHGYPSQMGRVINTDYGRLRGTLTTFPGSNLQPVEVYKGLQYATTVGSDLRFMPPTSLMNKWQGIHVAFDFKPVCPQKIPDLDKLRSRMPHGRVDHLERIIPFVGKQTEDCLYLNVYVPTAAGNSSSLLPILMFVHAENYEFGTGNAYDGSVLASYNTVIVVTMNFRLGPFGFLTRGDGCAQGNYALLDIAAALHFVRHNIESFGGDKSRITLMGQGHGAALINFLLVSPLSRAPGGGPLFERTILMSGSALSSWALSNDPMRLSQELANKVNCSGLWDTSPLLLECLNNRTFQEILSADLSSPTYTSTWGPVIDKRSVLTQDVRTLIERGHSAFGDIDMLVGVMKSEGLLFFTEEEVSQGITELRKMQMIRTYVRNVYAYQRQLMHDVIWHEYTQYDQKENPNLIRDEVMTLLGDAQYVAPVLELADYHQHFSSSTYLYSFHYPSRLDSYPRWTGGVHGDDLTYVFGAPLVEELSPFTTSYTDTEKMLSEAVMTYWTNFVKSGNPNSPVVDERRGGAERRNRYLGTDWPVYNLDRQQYLLIDRKIKPEVEHHMKGSKMALWLELIPKLHKDDDLDVRYHLLDDYSNSSLFDSEGVRPVNYKQILIPPPITPPIPPFLATTTAYPTTTTTTEMPNDEPIVTRRRKQTPPAPRRTTPLPARSLNEASEGEGTESDTVKLSSNVTLGVGCALLFLNIIIFAAVYYQKDKIKQERKAHERALNREQSEHMIGSDQDGVIKSSSASDSEGASSYGTHSPPLSGQEGVIRTRVSTLPLHQRSPIPVTPPMAPYNTLPHHGNAVMYPPPPGQPNHRHNISPHAHYHQHNHINSAHTHNNGHTHHSSPPPPPPCNSIHYANTDSRNTIYSNSGGNAHTNMGAAPPPQQQENYCMSNMGPHEQSKADPSRRLLKRGSPVDSPTDNHIQTPSTVV